MLAKELVSNAFDEESVSKVEITLHMEEEGTYPPDKLRHTVLIVEDDGDGFADLKDAYTLYGWTRKRENPRTRGRFNVGEKEIVALASHAEIQTTSGWVEWHGDERLQGDEGRPNGTLVLLHLPWTEEELNKTVEKLKQLIPPEDKTYLVNDEEIPHRKPIKTFTAQLATVLLKGNQLAPTARKTEVHIYNPRLSTSVDLENEPPTLLEMGIPVQDIDTPWHIDVQQKIPLSPHRNAVTPGYLQDVYAEALNVMASGMTEEQVSASWVDKAMTDKRCDDKTVLAVSRKRYPDTVLWSPDKLANETARDKGFNVLHSRGIDKEVLTRLKSAGMQTTHEQFGVAWAKDGEEDAKPTFEVIAEEDWMPGMLQMKRFIESLGIELLGFSPHVSYERIKDIRNLDWCASWGNRTLHFFVNKLAKNFFDGLGAEQMSIILHEFSHHGPGDEPHDVKFRDRLEDLAGKATLAALEFPELFDYAFYSSGHDDYRKIDLPRRRHHIKRD